MTDSYIDPIEEEEHHHDDQLVMIDADTTSLLLDLDFDEDDPFVGSFVLLNDHTAHGDDVVLGDGEVLLLIDEGILDEDGDVRGNLKRSQSVSKESSHVSESIYIKGNKRRYRGSDEESSTTSTSTTSTSDFISWGRAARRQSGESRMASSIGVEIGKRKTFDTKSPQRGSFDVVPSTIKKTSSQGNLLLLDTDKTFSDPTTRANNKKRRGSILWKKDKDKDKGKDKEKKKDKAKKDKNVSKVVHKTMEEIFDELVEKHDNLVVHEITVNDISLEVENVYKQDYDERIKYDWDINIDFTADDNPNDIKYIEDNGKQILFAATFNELMKLLISPQLDMDFQSVFFFCFKCFAPTRMVLLKIREKLEGITHNGTPTELMLKTRCIGVISTLLENFFDDFDQEMIESIQDLIQEYSQYNAVLAKKLQTLLDKKIQGIQTEEIETVANVPYPESIIPKTEPYTLIDLDPEELARQITLTDYKIFSRIKKSEFINQSWNKEGAHTPNVKRLMSRFNEINSFVTVSICGQSDLSTRASIFSLWVHTAQTLFQMRNYHGFAAIMSSLENASVYRLKKTKEKSKTAKILKDIEGLITPMDGYHKYKQIVRESAPPCIPHVGIYLTDLTYMEEGHENVINDRLINFHKLKNIYDTVHVYLQYQSTPYHYAEIPEIQSIISKGVSIAHSIETQIPNIAFELSLQAEPRSS